MKKYNCILVIDCLNEKILFCKRAKPPYQGMLNLVGGRIEKGEENETAAYSELYEETGIRSGQISLRHFMDMTYYDTDILLEIYVGYLRQEVVLKEEKQELLWVDKTENFFNGQVFAGDGNIGHIVKCLGI